MGAPSAERVKLCSIWADQSASSLSLSRHAHGPLAKHLMYIVLLFVNTSGVSKSLSDWLNTGFPGDASGAFIFGLPGNKDAVAPNSLTKQEICHVNKCDGECL